METTRAKRINELTARAARNGIEFHRANHDDLGKIGIHIFGDDVNKLEDALNSAINNFFPYIWVHEDTPDGKVRSLERK